MYDYIIVGGGTAGPVLAARLTENPRTRVLLLEAGPENTFEASGYVAGAFAMWGPRTNWGYASSPQPGLNGREIAQPRGKLIGGSAAINIGSWSRGTRGNYESWDLPGWDWDTIVQLYKRIENTTKEDVDLRGQSGKMQLEMTPAGSEMTEIFRRAAIEAGIGITQDRNAAVPTGFDLWECIYPLGHRFNTENGYLKVARSRANLTVLTEAFVSRVIFDRQRAVRVCYTKGGQEFEASAEGEILLCGGAINSPQLLMLSGVGPADQLREHGIAVTQNLAAVGSNLADHLRVDFGALTPVDTGETAYADPNDPAQLAQWRRGAYGPLTIAENTSAAFVKSDPSVAEPDIEIMYSINPPLALRATHPERAGWYMNVGLVQPKSTGSVSLNSADACEKAIYDPGYLSHPDDVATYIKGMRIALSQVKTATLAAYTDRATLSLSPEAGDDEIEAHIRATAESTYHPVGSARMGRGDDPTAALDPQCRVKGVEGLRVVDAASIPALVSGHTMAPTILVAERVADFMMEG
ncbi:MAG: GMC family oxidoreductase N-terminal domain-containing protein [Pseudomonadota bacterium]